MKILLKNSNSSPHYKIGEFIYNLIFILRDNELIITTENGKEIASLRIEVMECDDKKPTKSFWLRFCPVMAETCKDSADVFLE